jgi:N-methylhydantoinase A/oxoprolinase/acetone carboxylase beta subunit
MIIGLDVGGTHADVVLLGTEGLVVSAKVPTDAHDLFHTVLRGLEEITADVHPEAIHRIVLSTTLTTNAIVQGQVPPVGMIVSGGPGIDPTLFRTNEHFFTVGGAIDHRGRIVEAVDPRDIKAIAKRLRREGIRQVGVVGKFSVRNPVHETEIARILGDDFDKIFLGHRVAGSLNFPRRIATTYLNAAVHPVHKQFFIAVQRSLSEKGLTVPIRILKADGGNMQFAASIDFPAQTALSGPAASVMGSLAFAPDEDEALVFDIGGTTTDMAVLVNGVPLLDPGGIELGGYKTLIRALETHSIGMGGDSAVRVEDGALKIGPERRGPAMAYGGPVPTPTDAMFVLEMIRGEGRQAALEGLSALGAQLGLAAEAVAEKIFDGACRSIIDAAEAMVARVNSKPVYTVHEMLEGHTVKPRRILVLGGPALYFAHRLEEISGYKVGVIPRWKVANAIGAALARTTCEVTVFADTERGIVTAPEENYTENVSSRFSGEEAVQLAYRLLRDKAARLGGTAEAHEVEVVENLQFNMVRGFYTSGKNIRVRVQVKPGLIQDYDPVAGRLTD